ncbi:DUF7527 domain-containing protein [Halorussus salinisoli]|uniref:DUF7527 domain-containing protein n=1 Tax=Halorussus salinisoli TaxID=2558242 RepID=UPI0010C18BD1|nr:transcriptional regulator [Halorussus salinisoli]
METRTVEQVESWRTRSFADGFAGLRELSDGEFSGAVRAGGAWLFMLNGRIIGVFEGSLDDFEDADGTAYAAPHPSLPLLFSMQERGGETQAKYYTNDTPLSDVDSTLTDGKFTGYVELSENVLSGDYYVAYYGGRSMSVAFVGASEQVVTGDDAFERANDEVGIYEVRDVNIEVTDVPEPDDADESTGGTSGGSGTSSGGTDAPSGGASATSVGTDAASGESGGASGGAGTSSSESGAASDGAPDSGAVDATPTEGSAGRAGGTDASLETESGSGGRTEDVPGGQTSRSPGQSAKSTGTQSPAGQRPDATDRRADRAADSASEPDREAQTADASPSDQTDASAETSTSTESSADTESATSADRASDEETVESTTSPQSASSTDATHETTPDAASDAGSEETATEDVFDDEEEWREATTIPSLDPDRSEGPKDATTGGTGGSSQSAASVDDPTADRPSSGSATSGKSPASAKSPTSGQSRPGDGTSASRTSVGRAEPASDQSAPASGQSAASGSSASGGASEEASEEARERVQKLRSQLEQRKQQVEQLKQRLSNVESERNEYKRERDALRQEVERLEAKLETTESAGSGSANRQLSRSQAFDGTNLFVRYESKGKATLDEAAEGKAEADDVNANLRLEHHTQFEADDVDVEGESFEEFLTDSFEYQFVAWVVEELLYEIRDTGHRTGLKELYESIPKIDRVDLHGSVSAGDTDEDTRQEAFDIIMRDRMGNPLVVADLNGSRDPTTGDMMGSLVDASSGVAHAHDELSGAFQVTESFFEPEALETTESATSGGFLSREKRESFVKLSRKRGYHLCLVESRSGGFHLNVPEL